jgi:Activator of Hsp90 ATPase homolog 1-like protein
MGMSTPVETISVDARPGGTFKTVMVNESNGSRYPTSAVFDIVDEPETLAWTETETGMQVTIRFVALTERTTKVEIHQLRVPEAGMAPQAQAGFLTSLDRFELYLAHLQQGGQRS